MGEDVAPRLKRAGAATLALVRVVAWNVEPPIVVSYRCMIQYTTGEPRAEDVLTVYPSQPRTPIGVRRPEWLPRGVAEPHKVMAQIIWVPGLSRPGIQCRVCQVLAHHVQSCIRSVTQRYPGEVPRSTCQSPILPLDIQWSFSGFVVDFHWISSGFTQFLMENPVKFGLVDSTGLH